MITKLEGYRYKKKKKKKKIVISNFRPIDNQLKQSINNLEFHQEFFLREKKKKKIQ